MIRGAGPTTEALGGAGASSAVVAAAGRTEESELGESERVGSERE
jgi:hypothetical protein